MTSSRNVFHEQHVLPKDAIGDLLTKLKDEGYRVAAPVEYEGVLALREIDEAGEIARGWRDDQRPGHYRLEKSEGDRVFDNVVGPDSAKRFFFPPTSPLFSWRVEGDDFALDCGQQEAPRWAVVGVRPCDLAAIAKQDKVFGHDAGSGSTRRCESETYYSRARNDSFIVAVNCTQPGGSCFCDSWGTGPEAREGYDLVLTELGGAFLVESGSSKGHKILDWLPTRPATEAELELVDLKLSQAREHMGRRLETEGLPELLERNVVHRIWETIAARCLGCRNCTMVCPTCFCSTVTDSNDLATGAVARTRRWESCFTHEFSYVTSGPMRSSTAARYRHWLTHKLGTWWEQFGSSGCVGCGRCLTWCPVAIDWTVEIAQLQKEDAVRQLHEEEQAQEVRA